MSYSGNFIDKSKISNDSGYCKVDTAGDTNIDGKFCFNEEQTTPTAPADGNGWLYTKSDGKIYWQSFDVAETDLTSGGGGSSDKISNSNGKCEIQTNGDTFVDQKLGVNVTSPNAQLEVESNSLAQLRLRNPTASPNGWDFRVADTGQLILKDDGTEKARIDGTGGNIGKGRVGQWPNNSNFAMFSHKDTGGTGDYAMLQLNDGTTHLNAATSKFLDFRINNLPKMTVASNGYVGVGETSPTSNLHITNNINVNSGSNLANGIAPFFIEYGSNGTGLCMDANQIESKGTLLHINGTSDWNVTVGNGTNARLGVNTSSPQQKCDVNGNVRCADVIETSDDRIKYNETILDGQTSLNLINQLQPQYYEKIIECPTKETSSDVPIGTWMPTDAEWPSVKDQYEWKNEAGLVAQEVKVIPELAYTVSGEEVDAEGTQTPLSLNYRDIAIYHIAATKHLSSQVADLLARVTALENQ